MSIVIVGGHDKMECRYKDICKKRGCKCKVFTQCPTDLKSRIGDPDLVIIFTKTVAHKMVDVASREARKANAAVMHLHSSSACALNEALDVCMK